MTKHPAPLTPLTPLTLFLTLSYSFLLSPPYFHISTCILLTRITACNALGPEKLGNELRPRERQESLFPLSAGRRNPGNRDANLSLSAPFQLLS